MRTSSHVTLMTISSLLLLFVVGLTLRGFESMPTHASGAKASIMLSLTVGPPTTSIPVSGKGFKGGEMVILTFDATQLRSVKASKTGVFSTTIIVPSSEQPGNHFVQGRGSSSGFFAQATFLVQTDWVQQGFNREHTGFNVFENVLNTTNVSQLSQNWVYDPTYVGPAAIANGVVYISCYIALCAVNATTGQPLWSYTIGSGSNSAPAVANGLVYIGSYNNSLYALNAATGQLTWSFTTGNAIVGSPLVANGIVYVGSNDNKLYALNGATGKVVWSYTTKGSIIGTPGLDNGVVYIGSYDGNMYALTAQTGVLKWHFTAKGSITGTPAIANGVIYIASNDGNLYALNAITGILLWNKSIAATSNPAVANGTVYIAAGCNFNALSATTGTLLWNDDTSSGGYCIESTPTIANGVIYVGGSDSDPADGLLFTYNATTRAGLGVMSIDIGTVSDLPAQPIVVNGTVYCSTNSGLYTYHL